ncbi:MAG: type II toxin-antitoxin system Phd/YefM family antitoxin [Candidatus Marinimicrobia bacterium]|nr:type II toxin-antitoxin system Phd/YefM family antitoxin [Candidatus Neomarinimicrobiota bacterium]
MIQVNIHDAKTNFSRLIKKVLEGEEIIIAKGNKPVAKLIQLSTSERKRKIGSAKGKIKIASDFNELLNDFKEYIN